MHRITTATILLAFAFTGAAFALTLKGHVVMPEKTVVAGATVWLDQNRRVQKVTTADDGAFCFKDVKIEQTDVVAYKEGLCLAGNSGLPVSDMEFDLVTGPAGGVNIRVTDKDFKAVPGARIRSMIVSDQFGVAVDDLVEQGFPQLRANDKGELSIGCVPAGGFVKLVVSEHHYADSNVAYLPVRDKRQDIQLYDGVPVRGRVTAQGKPLASARVSIFDAGTQGQREIASAVSDPEGFYNTRVEKGGYMVTARHPDHAAPVPANVDVSKDEGAVADLEMPVTRTLKGKVLLPNDKPCPGSHVSFSTGGTFYEECLTGGDGTFTLRVGSPKGVLLIGAPPGYRTSDLPQVPVDMGEALLAELPPTKLKELPVIKGRITVPPDQGPVGKVYIESLDAEPPLRFLSDEQGAFEIRLGYQPDKNRVKFRAEHALRLLKKEFTVNLDQTGEVEFRLEPFVPNVAKRPPIPGRNDLSKLVGKPAPKMQCSDWFNSTPLDLEKLRGKVVVLTMWGGFDDSPFATNRINELCALYDLYQGVADDVAIVAVHDAGSDANEVAEYVRRYGLRFPVGRDADPFVTFVNYGVNFIPQTVIIDKKGDLQFDQVDGRLPELVKALRLR